MLRGATEEENQVVLRIVSPASFGLAGLAAVMVWWKGRAQAGQIVAG